eukprot:Phypoly_transcript_01863.p1 GENE.Phypoly_transcript_01863~~Phypoly_transcript_01863.p1  ORF type:complete len:975 (+),score=155.41 Phypoly_transcript_01863:99-3023(+)
MPRKKSSLAKQKKRVQFSDQHSTENNEHKSKTFCVCQKAASGFMLQCDRCKEWYHGSCVKIESGDVSDNTEFVCVMCSETKCSELINYPRKFVITRRSVGPLFDRNNPQYPAFLQQLSFCTCNSRDDGRQMVRCSICKEWYHTACAKIDYFDWETVQNNDFPEKTAFACLRCTDERVHLLVDEDTYYELCEKRKRHGAICEGEYTNTHSRSLRRHSQLHSLIGSELGYKSGHGSLANLQWNNFKTLETYDMYSWLDLAPWVLKRVPTAPSLVSIGTNRGSLEIFDLADDMPVVEGIGQEKNWIANRVKSHHRGTLGTTLEDISAIEWGPDASVVVVATWADGRIEVIDAHENTPVRAYEGHTGIVRALHVPSASPHMLVSASHDKRVILWDFRSDAKKVLEGHSGKVVAARTLHTYSEHCIISGGDSTIRVWDIRREDACLHTISVPEDRPISSFDLSRTHLAVNTSPGNLFLFSNLDLFSPSSLPHCSTLKGHANKFWSMGKVYFSADGEYLATGSEDGFLLVWEVKTGSLVYRSRTHSHWVWDLAWLPDSSSFPAPSIVTCSEDFTIAISGVGPGLVHNRVHEWGPVGYKNLRVPYATKVFARWPNGRYYHGTVDYEVPGIGGGGMCSVKFRGWHGPDSRATYEPIALFPDSSNCTCKKGHCAKDIPYANSSMDIPLSPPPSPSVTPSPTISPSSTPSSSPEPLTPSPSLPKRRRNKQTTESPLEPTPQSPPRTSSFGRTIKKSRILRSPPSSPKQHRNKKVSIELGPSEGIEISPEKTAKKKSPRKALVFSHTELIPEPNTTSTSSRRIIEEPELEHPATPLILDPPYTASPSSPPPQEPPLNLPSLVNLPSFPQMTIPWNIPATYLPIEPARQLPYPLSPSLSLRSHTPNTPEPSRTSQSLPPLSSIFNLHDPTYPHTPSNYATYSANVYNSSIYTQITNNTTSTTTNTTPSLPTQQCSPSSILLSPPKS